MLNYLYGLGALVAGVGGWWQYNRPKVGDTVILKAGAGTPIKNDTNEMGTLKGNMPPLVVVITSENGPFFRGRLAGLMNGGRQVSLQEFSMLAPVDSAFKDTSGMSISFTKEDISENTTKRLF